MYRIIDNKDGKILAICFEEKTAHKLLNAYDGAARLEDGTIRYVFEDVFQDPTYLMGQTLEWVGRRIRERAEKEIKPTKQG